MEFIMIFYRTRVNDIKMICRLWHWWTDIGYHGTYAARIRTYFRIFLPRFKFQFEINCCFYSNLMFKISHKILYMAKIRYSKPSKKCVSGWYSIMNLYAIVSQFNSLWHSNVSQKSESAKWMKTVAISFYSSHAYVKTQVHMYDLSEWAVETHLHFQRLVTSWMSINPIIY